MKPLHRGWFGVACLALAAAALPARADPEIMVHENDLAEVGEVVTTLHLNHALRGSKTSDDGTWPTHRLTNGMAELATGLAPGWEAGVHLPVMRAGTASGSARPGDWGASALMFRLKHIRELAGGYFIGFNGEYDLNARRYVAEGRSVEMRGIVGRDAEAYRITLNPHLMWGWGGEGIDRRPDFNVDFKALHKWRPDVAWGAELYTDWGKTRRLQPGRGDRTLYLVGEFETRVGAVHLGIGKGYQHTPEKTLVKLVWVLDY